jgi:N-dimethylarginine dimethylaminohydrolase
MCPPTYFAVSYRINPWMNPDVAVDAARARRQWSRLRDQLRRLGHEVRLMRARPGMPDLVFAANGGLVIGGKALVPRFRHSQRQAEAPVYASALAALGVQDVRTARHINEGEGDFRVVGRCILAGTGPRSDPRAPAEVADYFGLPAVALRLVDDRLYHLDTALAVLDEHTIAYWPPAFDRASRGVLRELYPDAITAREDDALGLGLNLISDGSTVVMAPGHDHLQRQIGERGLTVLTLRTDELRKAGGGAKCCVLEHHNAPV